MKKSKTLRAMIGGSVAAVMALSISLPVGANAATNDITVSKTSISYEQILKYFNSSNIQGFPFGNSSTVVTKPQTTPVPDKDTTTSVDTNKPADTTTSTGAVSDQASYAKQIVALVNKERAAAGLAPVSGLDSLHKVANAKATDMRVNNYFSHTSPTYGSPFDMLTSYGISYKAAGENIAKGQKTPEEVMKAWMNSSGHRANILNANFNYMGVGFDNNHWVQIFIGK